MAKKISKKATKKKVAKKPAKKTAKRSAPKKAAKKKTAKPVPKKAVKKAAPKKIEKRTTSINPYLTFPGNCEEAFNHYRSVFGGKFGYVGRFSEMPPLDGQTVPAAQANLIMHISLGIGSNSILMGSDSSPEFGHATNIGNNFSISLNATSEAEADKLYNGLSAGGQAMMPMSKTFWGSYWGMLVDRFGIQWMISYDKVPM